ncbi:MAG: hypothetical protein HRU32_08480 [Rhodobacteraceae bacterium]|nr:hypothetical protein [Paracoccaceae bacterium]
MSNLGERTLSTTLGSLASTLASAGVTGSALILVRFPKTQTEPVQNVA